MNSVVLYATRHGCAEEAARQLQNKINGSVQLVNVKKDSIPDLSGFDTVIIGGSIHAGRIQSRIKKFCNKNIDLLKQKRLGLYLCCMEEGETAQKQFDEAYPDELRNYAEALGLFGGAFDFEKMNVAERLIVKKVAKISESVFRLNEENILRFATIINGEN